jgi:hypothetical protein
LFAYICSYIQFFLAACHTALRHFQMELRPESWYTYKEALVQCLESPQNWHGFEFLSSYILIF